MTVAPSPTSSFQPFFRPTTTTPPRNLANPEVSIPPGSVTSTSVQSFQVVSPTNFAAMGLTATATTATAVPITTSSTTPSLSKLSPVTIGCIVVAVVAVTFAVSLSVGIVLCRIHRRRRQQTQDFDAFGKPYDSSQSRSVESFWDNSNTPKFMHDPAELPTSTTFPKVPVKTSRGVGLGVARAPDDVISPLTPHTTIPTQYPSGLPPIGNSSRPHELASKCYDDVPRQEIRSSLQVPAQNQRSKTERESTITVFEEEDKTYELPDTSKNFQLCRQNSCATVFDEDETIKSSDTVVVPSKRLHQSIVTIFEEDKTADIAQVRKAFLLPKSFEGFGPVSTSKQSTNLETSSSKSLVPTSRYMTPKKSNSTPPFDYHTSPPTPSRSSCEIEYEGATTPKIIVESPKDMGIELKRPEESELSCPERPGIDYLPEYYTQQSHLPDTPICITPHPLSPVELSEPFVSPPRSTPLKEKKRKSFPPKTPIKSRTIKPVPFKNTPKRPQSPGLDLDYPSIPQRITPREKDRFSFTTSPHFYQSTHELRNTSSAPQLSRMQQIQSSSVHESVPTNSTKQSNERGRQTPPRNLTVQTTKLMPPPPPLPQLARIPSQVRLHNPQFPPTAYTVPMPPPPPRMNTGLSDHRTAIRSKSPAPTLAPLLIPNSRNGNVQLLPSNPRTFAGSLPPPLPQSYNRNPQLHDYNNMLANQRQFQPQPLAEAQYHTLSQRNQVVTHQHAPTPPAATLYTPVDAPLSPTMTGRTAALQRMRMEQQQQEQWEEEQARALHLQQQSKSAVKRPVVRFKVPE